MWNKPTEDIITYIAGMTLDESRKFLLEIKTGNPEFLEKFKLLGLNQDMIVNKAKQLIVPSKQPYFVRLAQQMQTGKEINISAHKIR